MDETFLIKTEIKPSSIENGGNARYFLEDVKKGTVIRKQKIGSKSLQYFTEETNLGTLSVDTLKHYGHSVPKNCLLHTNVVFVNNPFLYTNHSSDPNIIFEYTDEYKYTLTKKDVRKGDEMFQNYCDFKEIEWFENFLKQENTISARQFGNLMTQ